jgi:hypothetical protein
MTYPFIPSHPTNVHFGRRGDVKWIVLHTTESDIGPVGPGDMGAENTAKYFQNPNLDVSSHFVVDDDSTVQCVKLVDEAFTNGPWNRWTITIEQEGRAAFDNWTTVHNGLLEQTASLLANLYTEYNVPLKFVTGAEIANAILTGQAWPKGVTTHIELNNAARTLGQDWAKSAGLVGTAQTVQSWRNLISHTDPGVNYPTDEVIRRARAKLGVVPPSQIDASEEGVFGIFAPVATDGRTCYARFSGTAYKSDTGGIAIRDIVWIDGPTYEGLKNLGFKENKIALTDLHGVALLGPMPVGDPIHTWVAGDFMRVIG